MKVACAAGRAREALLVVELRHPRWHQIVAFNDAGPICSEKNCPACTALAALDGAVVLSREDADAIESDLRLLVDTDDAFIIERVLARLRAARGAP